MKQVSYNLYHSFFKTLSNKTRFEIVRLLIKGQKNVNNISKTLKFEQSRVSHNLKRLEKCGFVSSKGDGKFRIYSIDQKYIVPIINNIDKYINKYNKRLKECCIEI